MSTPSSLCFPRLPPRACDQLAEGERGVVDSAIGKAGIAAAYSPPNWGSALTRRVELQEIAVALLWHAAHDYDPAHARLRDPCHT